MDQQNMNHRLNRRNFLKQAALGAGALAGLPSLSQPLLAADSGSRIESLELLVLKQNNEQRRVLKIISSTGVAGGYHLRPELNAERRAELVKVAHKYSEQAKISVRHVRRDGMEDIKKSEKDGASKDDMRVQSDRVQKLTDDKVSEIDAILATKEQEITQI